MDRFNLLAAGPDNPLFRFELRPDLDDKDLILVAVVVCLLLGHATYTDIMRGRLIYNSTTVALACVCFATAPLIFANPLPHIAFGLLVLLLPLFFTAIGGMGMGDLKLYTALSPLFGPALLALWFIAAVVTVLYSIPTMIKTRRDAKRRGIKLPKGKRLGSVPAGPGIAYSVPITAALAGVDLGLAALMALLITVAAVTWHFCAFLNARAQEHAEAEAAASVRSGKASSAADGDGDALEGETAEALGQEAAERD